MTKTTYHIPIDNFSILADDLSNTTTMTHNSANELLTQTDFNGTTTFTYDDIDVSG